MSLLVSTIQTNVQRQILFYILEVQWEELIGIKDHTEVICYPPEARARI